MKGRDMFFRASGDIKEVESQFKLVSTPSEIERVKVKSSIDRLESYDEEDSATNTVIVDPEPIEASIIPKDPNNDYEHLPEEEMTSPGESTGPVISNKAITVEEIESQNSDGTQKKKKTWGLFIGVIVIGAILIIASQAIKKEKQTA